MLDAHNSHHTRHAQPSLHSDHAQAVTQRTDRGLEDHIFLYGDQRTRYLGRPQAHTFSQGSRLCVWGEEHLVFTYEAG